VKAERLERLKTILASGKHIVDVEKGEVWSKYTGKKRKVDIDRGYARLPFYHSKDYQRDMYFLHEVIAVAGGLDILDLTVNHIDGNKSNNRLSNLEAISRGDNVRHAMKIGLRSDQVGENNPASKLTKKQVATIRALNTRGLYSRKELAKKYNVSVNTIHDILNRRLWNHGKG
jgi:hypothetical protein